MPTTNLGTAPGALDLSVYRGDTLTVPLSFTQGGVPLALPATGWLAQVRTDPDSTTAALTLTVDATNAATGALVVSATGAQTTLAVSGWWDLQNTNGSTVWTYLAGRFTVTKDVTHA